MRIFPHRLTLATLPPPTQTCHPDRSSPNFSFTFAPVYPERGRRAKVSSYAAEGSLFDLSRSHAPSLVRARRMHTHHSRNNATPPN